MSTTPLTWSDKLVLKQPQLDHTHEEFVALLNAYGAALASGADALPAFRELLAHTEAHFAMEEAWMAATGFAPVNCHSSQHAMVLNVMREVVRHATELNDREPMSIVLGELSQWFPAHAEMMDAALVYHMEQVGFDPASGQCRDGASAPAGGQHAGGCGSASCTPAPSA
ncbi:hemerythrin [Roseateles sp. DAIF2]|uniref:hemerythrin domain-containing protein n=1 Tax=Roseateles sp. DAIF2 TaxID=2714952 RepID=UPI0018A24CBF|nr:hemerythrin domain-containing protein [Roseateles sp. DAIF2]QPF74724.1 hemerythrin [Roseateles sp. DAIF2]